MSSAGRAWAALGLLVLARAFRAVLVTFLVVSAIPVVSSWSGYVVRSGSMEPGLSVGDVVLAQPFRDGTPVPVGRVMVFDNPDTGSGHATIMHRVVSRTGDGQFVTAGDANRDHDSTPVASDDFVARPSINVPLVGLPLAWWADRDLGPLVVWLGLIGAVLYLSVRPPCDARHRRRRAAATTGPVLVGVALVGTTLVGASPIAPADAAFTASTRSSANTWTVSTTLGKTLVLADVAGDVRGTVPLTATLNETSGRAFSVRIEYAAAGTTTWRTICTDTTAPFACAWATTGVPNGDYDLRAVATAGTTSYTSTLVEDVSVDNTAPTVVMQDPGTPLRGTVVTAATANDGDSGIASVTIQYAPTGSSTFKDLCTVGATPYTCRFDTTTVPGGSYGLRAVATDLAGNVTTSALVANRVVDNTVASVSVDDPGAFLSGTVQLTAQGSSSAGITSVRIQRAAAGTTTWTDVCTDTVAPYSCAWSTTAVADGLYDLRAVMLDQSGRVTTSATVAGRRVDNSPIRGFDVQSANGGSIVGRLQGGDTLTLTYTQQAALTSISPGWTGSALGVTVRLRDGYLLGLGTTDDTITVLRNGATVNLGSVNLRQNYIKSLRTADLAATMTASTVTVNGVAATRITLTMGAQTSGSTLPTVSTSSVMVWTPSGIVTNLAGRAASAAPTAETGASDREF
jgi:signal peptidase I